MKFPSGLAIALVVVFGNIAIGQKNVDDGPVGIFGSRSEYNQFMGDAKTAAYGDGGNEELQAMIPMLNDIVLDKPVGWSANEYGAAGSTMGILSNENIRSDIEMVDDQYQELQDLSARIQSRAADQIRGLNFKDAGNLVAQIQNIRKQSTKELNAVLLPHQLKRLRQIQMQSLLQRRSLAEVLTTDPVKSELEITDRQSDELKDFEKVVKEDLAKEIAKLQEVARNRLLSKLNPNQEQRAKDLIGEAFEFKSGVDKKRAANSDRKKPNVR